MHNGIANCSPRAVSVRNSTFFQLEQLIQIWYATATSSINIYSYAAIIDMCRSRLLYVSRHVDNDLLLHIQYFVNN